MALELPLFSKKKNEPAAQDAEPSVSEAPLELTATDASFDFSEASTTRLSDRRLDIRLPLIGHRTRRWQERFLMTVLFFSIVFAIVFALAQWQRSYLTTYQTQLTTEMERHHQQLNTAAVSVTQAEPGAVSQLETAYEDFLRKWANLQALHAGTTTAGAEVTGGGRSAYEASPELLAAARKVAQIWEPANATIRSIMSMKEDLSTFASSMEKVKALSATAPKDIEQIAETVAKNNPTSAENSAASQLRTIAQRIERGKNAIVTADGVNIDAALAMSRDINAARGITEGFLIGGNPERLGANDPAFRSNLAKMQNVLSTYQQSISAIVGSQQVVQTARQQYQQFQSFNEPLKDNLNEMKNIYFDEMRLTHWTTYAMLASIAIVLLSLGSFMIVQIQGSIDDAIEAEKRRQDAERQRHEALRLEEEARELNERNQAAILRLMNELAEVADGDLTVQATVSEDITGAIADSINFTVEELRELVGRVTNTAQQVNDASEEAAKISTELIGASQQQSREIEDATQLVLRMAEDINSVSQSANESAEVARQSLMVAAQGAAAVENTIKGMNEIRDQIQETAKRIKRLGESSQEIGEITELISDITEQTNVLALNAAIQAASAGEAGRGFSVVAEEVQRLAERSAEATKQIGALVRTIQTDTHDAVAAMENSTQGVVEGARLSDAAGAALADISRVSNQLAELIQNISVVTEKHAATASGLAQNIQHILGITEQTQHGTEQTASSIQQLATLAEELRTSVARFRVSV